MTRRTTASVFSAIALAAFLAGPPGALLAGAPVAWAQSAPPAGVTLAMGRVRSDPAGAFITVTATNATADIIPELRVQCTFYAGNQALGTSATKIFSIFAGTSGSDQVRLLGASGATRAACRISPQQN